ncbi:hypothetical protein B296_00008250 [Ensete ventricosum]|uniref:Uncharacterized protein n=1 Tax=Ensete ventricosum TaxID=4639 RepID=A0A426XZ92_ENSVE|nr:hypothetical protein B296_00008250 [Ensete ventricosum]
MIAPTEEPKLEDMTPEPKEKDTPQSATRTVPTLAGYTNLQILKIEGFLEQHFVIILIGAGSTHNFMSSKVAAHLMLKKEDYSGFEVKVANSQILKCNQKCPRVKLILQEQDIVADFFLLPLDSFDIMLGNDWLSTIGDIASYQGLQFRYLPPVMGGTYRFARLPVRGPPATGRFRQKSIVGGRLKGEIDRRAPPVAKSE